MSELKNKNQEQVLNVLLVDDSIDDREYFRYLIDESEEVDFCVEEATNADDALEKLSCMRFDCVVVDYNMPGHNGVWLVQQMQQKDYESATILLTGGGSERIAVESMKSGTQDYLSKTGIDSTTLSQTILEAVENKSSQLELLRQTRKDELTGVANRRSLLSALDKVCSRAQRFSRAAAILYMDLNGFKSINDTYGHQAGDEALKQFALCLSQVARNYDTVARMGGDEFVVLLDELEGDGMLAAIRVAKRILEDLKALEIEYSGSSFGISSSIGISLFPQHTSDPGQLIELADMAMYTAKKSGAGYYLAEEPCSDLLVSAKGFGSVN
jgi:diguanylate cyclase (GGDEF)-like protein